MMIFQPAYASSGSPMARAYPGCSGHKAGPTLDRSPFHQITPTPTLTQTEAMWTCTPVRYGRILKFLEEIQTMAAEENLFFPF